MSQQLKLHRYQVEIIKALTPTQGLKFNEIKVKGLESEHMNYHLKQLLSWNFVEKSGGLYLLTDLGKDYCNLLDDNVEIIEKQPKTSVIIRGTRLNKSGEIENLLTKRLRQPYYGKVGRITGKVRFGEKLEEAAARELQEETGLTAKVLKLEEVYHKIRHRENGEVVQDVIFYIFYAEDFEGDLIDKTDSQENFWATNEQAKTMDVYDDFDFVESTGALDFSFSENIDVAKGF